MAFIHSKQMSYLKTMSHIMDLKYHLLSPILEWLQKSRLRNLSSVHPETRLFSFPSMGEGKGGGDYGSEFQDFLFSSLSPRPSPARGEGVCG